MIRKKKVYKKVDKRIPPVTSEKTLNLERKKQNATNKARSKQMENRIATTLKGRRIPMSGAAAQFKGDVEVLFNNYPGKYIIECKLTAMKNTSNGQPMLRLDFKWFPKIQEEATAMNAKFGVLIIHYKDHGNDYVFAKRSVINLLTTRYESPYTNILTQLLDKAPLLDVRNSKAGKPLGSYKLQRGDIETAMIAVEGFQGVRYLLPDDEYLVMHLSTWRVVTAHM